MQDKQSFLKSDRRLTRREIDGADKLAYWNDLAKKVNDPNFKPEHINSSLDPSDPERYHKLSLQWDAFVADGRKVKKEFNELRGKLTLCCNNLAISGGGECKVGDTGEDGGFGFGDEAENEGQGTGGEEKASGKTFLDFSQGDLVLELAYELFRSDGLLDACTTKMPARAKTFAGVQVSGGKKKAQGTGSETTGIGLT